MDDRLPVFAAEAIGTALVVIVAVATLSIATRMAVLDTATGWVGVGAVVGLTYAIAIGSALPLSGGHLNPAVTLAALATGRVDGRTAGSYLGAQVLGSLAGGGFMLVAGDAATLRAIAAGAPTVGTIGVEVAMLVEAGAAALVAAGYWGLAWTDRHPAIGGAAVGLAYAVAVAVAGPLTGGAANPARALGPQVVAAVLGVSGILGEVPLYWIGPLLGALLAAVVLDFAVDVPRARHA